MLDIEVSYVNQDRIARYMLDFDNRKWFPRISDLFVPGLSSILEYFELNYATVASLQNAITDMSNHIQTEIDNLEIPTNPTNPSVSEITRYNYISYEHNIINNISIHIHNTNNYYNFYSDTFNMKKNMNVDSHSVNK